MSFVFKICFAVTALYYVGLNGFLFSPWAGKLMKIAPEAVQISYSQAYTIIPFRIEVDDLRISIQDPLMHMYISADHAGGSIYPWTLIKHQFFATNLRGEGVVFRMRMREDAKNITPAMMAMMPPIPGYPSMEKGEPLDPRIKPLGVELTHLVVKNLHQVWINEFNFDGHIDVDGGFALEALKSLRLDHTALTNIKGTLTRAKKHFASIDEMKLEASLPEISLEKPDLLPMLTALDVKLSVNGKMTNATFLNAYLRDVPAIHIDEGGGTLALTASVEKGIFGEDSKLTLDTSRLIVQMPYLEVVGRGSIRWQVKKGTSYFSVHVPEVVALSRKDQKKTFTGTNFDLNATTTAEISKMNYLNLDVAIEKGKAVDLQWLNTFIPDGAGIHIAGGQGTLTGKLAVSTRTRKAKGSLEIEGNQLSIKNRSATLIGHAKIHGEIRELNIDTGAMDISGSSIALSDVGVWADGDTHRGFWLKLVADPCIANPLGATKWSTKLLLDFQNLQPVLSMVSANAPIPGVLKAFADVPNVRVSSEVIVRAKEIDIRKLRVDSSKVQVDGEFKLQESGELAASESKLYPWGAMLVKVRALSAGVDFQGPMVRPILGDPQGWYTKYRADHPAVNVAAVKL